MNPDLRDICRRFNEEKPRYEKLTHLAKETLSDAIRKAGIRGEVKGRAKDLTSFLGKVLRKRDQYSDPLTQIRDRAGLRVIVSYPSFITQIKDVVRRVFVVEEEDDKALALGDSLLGYVGFHFLARLRGQPDLEDLVLEIQIHTGAQTTWAEVSHDLLYKIRDEAPLDLRRRVNRLQALVELYDDQIDQARKGILAHSGYQEAKLLSYLEPHFLSLGGRDSSPVLSHEILAVLGRSLTDLEKSRFPRIMESFVNAKREKIEGLLAAYQDDFRYPLMHQPECLLVFERLQTNRDGLIATWSDNLEIEMLNEMGDVWGTPLS